MAEQTKHETKQEAKKKMRTLRNIQKWVKKLMDSGLCLPVEIDSHKWESKIEIFGHFSGGH